MDQRIDFDRFVAAVRDLELEVPESQAMYHPSRVNTEDWQRIEQELAAARDEEAPAEVVQQST